MELEPIPAEAVIAIERTRDLTRRLGAQIAECGIAEADIATGISLGLHDLVTGSLGDPAAAFEWQRTAVDLMERWHMEGRYAKPE